MNHRHFIKTYNLLFLKIFVPLLLFLSISSCSGNKKTSESENVTSSPIQAEEGPSQNPTTQDTLEVEDDECVFNNDFKGLTTAWLQELRITDFIWREDLHGALIPEGQDTIFISQGGCGHFGFSVDLWMRTPAPNITDSTFWISKALELADKYQMTEYSEIIRKGKLRRAEIDAFNVWYEVFPENQAENEVFDGIAVVIEKDFTRLSMSKYFN